MEEISLEEAKIHLKNLLYDTYDFRKYSRETDRQAINKVLKELDNRIPKEIIINELEKEKQHKEEYEKQYGGSYDDDYFFDMNAINRSIKTLENLLEKE